MYEVQKKPAGDKGGSDRGAVQKRSLVQREEAKRGGFDVQMKKLTPEDEAGAKKLADKNTVDAQDPAALAKFDEDAKKGAATRKGVDPKVMGQLEADFQAAAKSKDMTALGKLASKALELQAEATPEQYPKLQEIIAAYANAHPDKDKNVVDIN